MSEKSSTKTKAPSASKRTAGAASKATQKKAAAKGAKAAAAPKRSKSTKTTLAARSAKAPVAKKAKVPARASHDAAAPAAFREFMRSGWRQRSTRLPAAIRGSKNFHARRRALSEAFPGELLVIPTGHEKVRANDTFYPFRPSSDFVYLTGNMEPDCVLVLEPTGAKGHRDLLFVEPNPGKTDDTFFLDRNKGELWVGPRLGVPESQARFAVDEALPLEELSGYLRGWKGKAARILRGYSPATERAISTRKAQDEELATYLSEARLIKDRQEVRELEKAIASTHRALDDVIERLATAQSEREIEGVFHLRARMEGNDTGYGVIAAAGANACILHWRDNDGPIKAGELLLIDAGIEAQSLYTADITRTFPISGKFSKEQKEVYELVLQAELAAIDAVQPGNDFLAPHRAAMRVLAEGLERMGLLPTSAEEALEEDKQYYRRYTLHGTSHMLGLDVHDNAQARPERYRQGKLEPGMVLTIEPGLYFQKDDTTVPARYRGIGVRIEDNVLVTAKGNRVLSAAIPKAVSEVEGWMKQIWRERKVRRSS